MSAVIQIKAGKLENMPKLADREIGFVRDEDGGALYIGTENENKKLCAAGMFETLDENLASAEAAAQAALEAAKRAEAAAGGVSLEIGDSLKWDADGKLSVDTADAAEQDNTRPITSAAVYTEIGNIEAILKTI